MTRPIARLANAGTAERAASMGPAPEARVTPTPTAADTPSFVRPSRRSSSAAISEQCIRGCLKPMQGQGPETCATDVGRGHPGGVTPVRRAQHWGTAAPTETAVEDVGGGEAVDRLAQLRLNAPTAASLRGRVRRSTRPAGRSRPAAGCRCRRGRRLRRQPSRNTGARYARGRPTATQRHAFA